MTEVVDLAAAEGLARAAFAQYGISATTPLILLKNRENFVFSLRTNDTDYVLRVHRSGYHSDAELECELDFVQALGAEGVAVPHFIPASDGRFFVTVGEGSPAGPHQVDLQLLLENQGNFGDERTAFDGTADIEAKDFAALGELAARAHDAAARSGFKLKVPRQDWDAAGLVGPNATWGDPLRIPELTGQDRADVEAAIVRIGEVLADYGMRPERYGPIHSDLTPENVLRTETGLVLIDFDDFAQGWHLFDLATAIYFFTPHPRYDEYRAALFAGYEAVRPLDDRDRAAFAAILLARGLTYLGWAADRRGEAAAEFHATEVMPQLVTLSRELLAQPAVSTTN